MSPKVFSLFFLLLLFSFWNLKPCPNYNPFDEATNINVETLLADGCQLLYQPCGYGTYGKEVDGNIIYYQFNPGEEDKVCAKGICIHIDSTLIASKLILNSRSSRHQKKAHLIQKLLSERVDSSKVIAPLLKWGVRHISHLEVDSSLFLDALELERLTGIDHLERTWYFKAPNHQIYSAEIDFKVESSSNNQSLFIRTLELFVSTKRKRSVDE